MKNGSAPHRALKTLVRMEKICDEDPDEEPAEIVREGGQVWIGYHRIRSSTLDRLLMWCLVRDVSDSVLERYTLNEDGRRAAADPSYRPPELLAALRARR